MLKKTIYLSVLCVSVLTSTGCGAETSANASIRSEIRVESSVKSDDIEQEESIKEINITNLPKGASEFIYKDNIFFYMERAKGKVEVHIENLLTGEKNSSIINNGGKEYIGEYDVSKNLEIYYVSSPKKGTGLKHSIHILNKKGEQISQFNIDDYPVDIAVGDDGNIYLAFEKVMYGKKNIVEMYSKEGEKLATMEVGYYPSFVKLGDGTVCVLETDENQKNTLSKYDFKKNKKIEGNYDDVLKDEDYYGIYDGHGKYQFYVVLFLDLTPSDKNQHHRLALAQQSACQLFS